MAKKRRTALERMTVAARAPQPAFALPSFPPAPPRHEVNVDGLEAQVLPALHAAIEYAVVRGDGGNIVSACRRALDVLTTHIKSAAGREPILPAAPRRDD